MSFRKKSRFVIEIKPAIDARAAKAADHSKPLTEEQMAEIVLRMQAAARGEPVEPPGPVRQLRITCLTCGKQIGKIVTLAAGPTALKEAVVHVCKASSDRHWRKVVRDAFLEGNDEAAIAVMRRNLLEEEDS